MSQSNDLNRRHFIKQSAAAMLCFGFVGGAPRRFSATYATTTEKPLDRQVRIALLSDPHVSLRPQDEQFGKNFDKVIRQANAENVDAMLLPGDLTTHGFQDAVQDYLEYTEKLNAPFWHIPGNHDIGNKPMPGRTSHLSDRRVDQFERVLGPSFYETEIVPGIRMIAANSAFMGMGLDREPEHWGFLEDQLAEPSEKFTIFMTHYPLFVRDVDEDDAYFNIEPQSRRRMLELLKQGGVDLLVCGHTHNPRAFEHDGIPHIIAPAISFGLPHDRQPEGWTMLTIDPDRTARHEDHLLE